MEGWRDLPSYRVGRVVGVPLYIDALYPLMPIVIGFSLIGRNAPSFAKLLIFGLIAVAGATLSILAHEISHAMAARMFKLRTEEIRISGFYGLAIIEQGAVTRGQEIAILLAGPLANAALFILLWVLLGMPALSDRLYFESTFDSMVHEDWLTMNSLRWLAYLNLGLAAFNLVPAFPLDGGRICRAYFLGTVRDDKLVRSIAWIGVFIGVWSLFGAVAFSALFPAGILLISANYGIAKGEFPAPD